MFGSERLQPSIFSDLHINEESTFLDDKFQAIQQIKDSEYNYFNQRKKLSEEEIDEFLNRTTQLVYEYESGKKVHKLREPRNLYALTKESGPQQATRWPSHVQCLYPPIKFVHDNPQFPEPLQQNDQNVFQPEVRGGEVVYLNEHGNDPFFTKSRVITSPVPNTDNTEGNTLQFESRFESGNLYKAEKVNEYEYELTLRPDLYTNKHTQWYFFRVENMKKDRKYRFTITNLMKPTSLYNNGMQPVFYSEYDASHNKIGWRRRGSEVSYYKNNITANQSNHKNFATSQSGGRNLYSLTWTCQFDHENDTCYFAHCYPYTYTDLQDYLLELANDDTKSTFCKQRVLCRTLAGNMVYVLTITSPTRDHFAAVYKRAVVLTARVHPGETNSSYMMKGFLDYLTSDSPDAKLLRDTFIFKIVPMLNPDGVIVGNYRCSLTGRDLNRNYKSNLKEYFPSIWHTKHLIGKLQSDRGVTLYCDLHGHSRKHNVFIYGCENKGRNNARKLHEQVFPLMLSKNASSLFSLKSCKYKVQKSKMGTGRIVVWCMGVENSYTMEATFGGSTLEGAHKQTHLSTGDLESIGRDFCDTLLDYCDPDQCKIHACIQELKNIRKIRLEKKARGDISSEDNSDTSGSDSSCDDGLPVNLLLKQHPSTKKKRRKVLKSTKERNMKSSALKANNTPPATRTFLQKNNESTAKTSKPKEISRKIDKKASKNVQYTSEKHLKQTEYIKSLVSNNSILSMTSQRARTTPTLKEFTFRKETEEVFNRSSQNTAKYLTERTYQLSVENGKSAPQSKLFFTKNSKTKECNGEMFRKGEWSPNLATPKNSAKIHPIFSQLHDEAPEKFRNYDETNRAATARINERCNNAPDPCIYPIPNTREGKKSGWKDKQKGERKISKFLNKDLENENNNHIFSNNHIAKVTTSKTAINFERNIENRNSTEGTFNNEENNLKNKFVFVSRPTPNCIKVFNAKKKLKQSLEE